MTLLDALTLDPATKLELAEKLGLYTATGKPDTRSVEALVQQYRLDGVAIWSDSEGYRLCRNAAEAETCYERLRHRALTQLRTAWAVRRTARRLAAQERIRPEWPAWT